MWMIWDLAVPAAGMVPDVLPVSQDRDPVGQRDDLVEPVGDVDDRHALRAQLPHEGEEVFHLLVGERRGGLVHDEHVSPQRDGLGDLHDLPGSHAQLAQRPARVHVEAQPAEDPAGLPVDPAPVDEPASQWLVVHEDVLADARVVEQLDLLVDHVDPQLPRPARGRGPPPRLPFLKILPRSFWMTPPMIFTRVDLPGAVLADHGVDLAAQQREAHLVEGLDGPERLVQVLDPEGFDGIHGRPTCAWR